MEESNQKEDGRQLTLKNLLFCESEEHRVHHEDDSKGKTHEDEASANSASENAKTHSTTSPSRRSPDPNCAICLGTLENKSFTDSCFHTFCFTCLVEWSKVKAECPLCKQPFKSIVHNVRSIEDYDQYYISSRSTDTSWRGVDGRSFRYRSTLTSERWSGRHRYGNFEDSIEYRAHRMIYAPHSVAPPAVRNLIPEYPSTSGSRRRIYEHGLWVRPLGDGNTQRYRITSPEFFRQNPACTHRLTPWLNRELLALLYDSESQVTFVLELILALIMRYDIRSEEFYVHIEPYLQHRTSHFIHEFYNYAASLHDMRSYDNCAIYERLETISENNTNVMSSPGSDVVPITAPPVTVPENSPSRNVIQALGSSDLSKKKAKKSTRRHPRLFLRRNQENIWQSIILPMSSQSVTSTSSGDSSDYTISSSLQGLLDLSVVPGPSTSGLQASASHSKQANNKSFSHPKENSGSSDSDNDCIVVDIVKPRTPELVDLVSSSEDERILVPDNTDNYCHATQVNENSSSSKQKEAQEVEETVTSKGPKRKQRLHRKRSFSSSSKTEEYSTRVKLTISIQSPTSPPPHERGISPSTSSSTCKTYIESDVSQQNVPVTSQEHSLYYGILDSSPSHDKHTSGMSCSLECSPSTFEYEETHDTKNKFSKISSSLSSPSTTLMSSNQNDHFTSSHSDSATNLQQSPSLSVHEESKTEEYDKKWQHNNSSSASSAEEGATLGVGEAKVKLRSVICRFPAIDQQNSRSDSSHHSSSRSKKHKHKKKKKHNKHKHRKHSHSDSD